MEGPASDADPAAILDALTAAEQHQARLARMEAAALSDSASPTSGPERLVDSPTGRRPSRAAAKKEQRLAQQLHGRREKWSHHMQ